MIDELVPWEDFPLPAARQRVWRQPGQGDPRSQSTAGRKPCGGLAWCLPVQGDCAGRTSLYKSDPTSRSSTRSASTPSLTFMQIHWASYFSDRHSRTPRRCGSTEERLAKAGIRGGAVRQARLSFSGRRRATQANWGPDRRMLQDLRRSPETRATVKGPDENEEIKAVLESRRSTWAEWPSSNTASKVEGPLDVTGIDEEVRA